MTKLAIIVFIIVILSLVFNLIFGSSYYEKCYRDREKEGSAIFSCCGGFAGGTYNTNYLSETCVSCPYLVLSDDIEKANKVSKAAQELDPIINECPCKKCSDDIRMSCDHCDDYYKWINRLKGEIE